MERAFYCYESMHDECKAGLTTRKKDERQRERERERERKLSRGQVASSSSEARIFLACLSRSLTAVSFRRSLRPPSKFRE